MATYSVKKGQQEGELILQVDGLQSICPFVQAIPMQGQYGGLQIMRLPCTSVCPHANQSDSEWSVTCSGAKITFPLEKDEKGSVIQLV